jgi:hypothetical protein
MLLFLVVALAVCRSNCGRGKGGAPAALARTNDLDADEVGRMLIGGAEGLETFQVMCCLLRWDLGLWLRACRRPD